MKILQILDNAPWSGRSALVHAVTRALIHRGHDVWVMSSDDITRRRFEAIGAIVARRRAGPMELSGPYVFLLCRSERFDLVVTHGSHGRFPGRHAARMANVPHIITDAHGFAPTDLQGGLLERILRFDACRQSDLWICHTDEQRRLAVRQGWHGTQQIITIPNGVDVRLFSRVRGLSLRNREQNSVRRFRIGALGTLESGQGHEEMLYATLAVVTRYPAVRLLIAGEGSRASELRQETSLLGLGDRVEFTGRLANSLDLISELDMFVEPSPSDKDTLGLLEAMAAGLPVVATDTPGNRELIRHGRSGLLVPPGNSHLLAETMCEVAGNPGLASDLGAAAADAAIRCFSLQDCVQRNIETYQLLAGQQSGPGAVGRTTTADVSGRGGSFRMRPQH